MYKLGAQIETNVTLHRINYAFFQAEIDFGLDILNLRGSYVAKASSRYSANSSQSTTT